MNVAIIVAAGAGRRMGGGRAKQFREISGIPIIIHTLRRFDECERVAASVVVLPRDECEEFRALAERHGIRKPARAVAGGETRGESVLRGLQALASDEVEIVAVHDGVRPFVRAEEIDRTVREAEVFGAAILAVPSTDTVKEVEGGRILRTLERAKLWRAQTPQCFRYDLLRRAYELASSGGLDATDDSALVERAGATVRVVEGGAHNIKITTPQDFALAEVIVQSSKFKVQS
jgi:2-C-methyl-D-erythritol 4-phosphate cytidylyltransferase